MARGGAAKEAANDIGRTELKTVVDNRTVGEILSEARIAHGMDYSDVAEQLRIRRTYIEAIEEGRLGDLPGSTYAIGFVRTYAELLDLDVPKIVAKFKQEAAEFEDRTQLVFPEPMPGSRGPTASVILIAVLMLAGAYGGWLYVSNKDSDTLELVPQLPENLSRLLTQSSVEPVPVEQPANEPAPAETAPAAAEPSTAQPSALTEQPTVQQPVGEAVTSAEEPAPTVVNETIASAPAPASAATETSGETVAETAAQTAETAAAAQVQEQQVQEQLETAAATPAEETQVEQATTAATSSAPTTSVATTSAQPADTQAATAETAAPAQQPAGDQPVVAQPVVADPVVAEPAAPTPAQQQETVAETVAAAPAETPAVASTEEAETALPTVGGSEPAAFGSDTGASRIVIRATSPAWVEITAANGDVLLNRLLRTGDTFRVPDQPGIKLVTGSAGGLEFTVDGQVAPSIGQVGDVRRDVLLEPDALLTAQ